MKGLQEDVTDQSLRALFEPFGRVLSATVPCDSSSLAKDVVQMIQELDANDPK